MVGSFRRGAQSRLGAARPLIPGFLVVLTACILFAQTDRGRIEGTVKDPNGAVVPGAKVQVVNVETNSRLDYETNEVGIYLASNLPVGSYRIVVSKEGFKTLVREP